MLGLAHSRVAEFGKHKVTCECPCGLDGTDCCDTEAIAMCLPTRGPKGNVAKATVSPRHRSGPRLARESTTHYI
jgi:hypothetical protein